MEYSITPILPGPDLANWLCACICEVCAPGPDLVGERDSLALACRAPGPDRDDGDGHLC